MGEPGPGSGTGTGTGGNASGSGGTKAIGATGCSADEECESNVCFKGNTQSFCTARCDSNTATAVCVPPLTGTCNKQGYCKRD
ncbi:MAG: hypothetical protein K0S65_1288 [Labilithrix sp.]|nr:hypothetical protein [Labilithrix sp.]